MSRMMIGAAWALLLVALAGCTDDGDGAGDGTGGGDGTGDGTGDGNGDGTGDGTGDGGTTHDVDIQGFQFQPATLTIAVGDTVRWTNQDSSPHTATGDDFDTGGLGTGESAEVTFDAAGSFEYVCTFHGGMQGTIVVE